MARRRKRRQDSKIRACNVCGGPLEGRGVEGTCQSCLLVQPLRNQRGIGANLFPSLEETKEALPRFEIDWALGQGGNGVVYLGVDRELGRNVAIKVVRDQPERPEIGERFSREAEVMAKLNHPNIVTVFDYGVSGDGIHYLVMEFLDGGTLEQAMHRNGKDDKTGRLPVERAITVFDQICDALQYAHSQGVVHRDVKPGNILLNRQGVAKLSDFGLVKGLLPEEFAELALTRTSVAVGTPLYMAPEQMSGSAEVDHRADIYSAGAVLYEMLTGETAKSRTGEIAEIDTLADLDPVFDCALHPQADGRFPRIDAFKEAIKRCSKSKVAWSKIAAYAGMCLVSGLLGIGLWKVSQSTAKGSTSGEPPNQESASATAAELQSGLPIGDFAQEIDLNDWTSLADYTFDDGPDDKAETQKDLVLEGEARIKGGHLVLSGQEDEASVDLDRRPGELQGLAFHVRLLPERYLAYGKSDRVIVQLALHWYLGLFLSDRKWEQEGLDLLGRDRATLVPPEKLRPLLKSGEWREVWMVLDETSCAVWVDNEPVYRGKAENDLKEWEEWGAFKASLKVGGFQGLIDHIEILEKR